MSSGLARYFKLTHISAPKLRCFRSSFAAIYEVLKDWLVDLDFLALDRVIQFILSWAA